MIENEDLFNAIQKLIECNLAVSSHIDGSLLYFDDDRGTYIVESDIIDGEYETLEEAVETFMNWE